MDQYVVRNPSINMPANLGLESDWDLSDSGDESGDNPEFEYSQDLRKLTTDISNKRFILSEIDSTDEELLLEDQNVYDLPSQFREEREQALREAIFPECRSKFKFFKYLLNVIMYGRYVYLSVSYISFVFYSKLNFVRYPQNTTKSKYWNNTIYFI